MYEDFKPQINFLSFDQGEAEKEIVVELNDNGNNDPFRDDAFEIELFDVEPETGKIGDKSKCMIHILGDAKVDRHAHGEDRIPKFMRKSHDISWAQQFKHAVMLHPSIDKQGNIVDVSGLQALFHF